MKIRVDVEAEVPDRDTCNGLGHRCKFLDIANNTILEYVCLIFDEYLQPDERYDALRCEQCLNATRVDMKTFNAYGNEICDHQPMPGKTCYCYNCGQWFHSLGIARHRAMHRDRKEDCTILDAGAGSITYCNFKED